MKLFLLSNFLISSFFFSQSSIIAKTESGQEVLLKPDGTWNFISSNSGNIGQTSDSCDLSQINEVQGRKDKIITIGEARLSDLKKHISVDLDCDIKNIKVIAASEQRGNGMYSVCACNKKVKYQKMGTVFLKDGQNVFK